MDKLRIAMVGAGRRGAGGWLPVIATFEDQLELVAVCNTGNPRGEEAANKYHTRWYTDLEQMLDKEKPDIVAIAVNPFSNLQFSKNLELRFDEAFGFIDATNRKAVFPSNPCWVRHKWKSYRH